MATYTTLTAALADYRSNGDWRSSKSTSKAQVFADAAESVLSFLPVRSGQGSASVEHDPKIIERRLEAAILWLDRQGVGQRSVQTLAKLEPAR